MIPARLLVLTVLSSLFTSLSSFGQDSYANKVLERNAEIPFRNIETYKQHFGIASTLNKLSEAVVEVDISDTLVTFYTATDAYQLRAYGTGIFALTLFPEKAISPLESEVIIAEAVPFEFDSEDSEKWIFEISSTEIEIYKDPFRFLYRFADGKILESDGFFIDGMRPGVTLAIDPGEHIEGTGSRALDINRNGEELAFYNRPVYGYTENESLLHTNIPLFISSEGYGLYFENPTPTFADIGVSNPQQLAYSAVSGPLTCFVIPGTTYDAILSAYSDLTGYQPLPPKWTLGYIQSRFGYESEQHARQVVGDMRINGFPMDALILDLYWFGDQSVMGNLEWDNGRFPDPEGMIDDFAAVGIKTVLIAETYVTEQSNNFGFLDALGYFGKRPNGDTYVMDNFWAGPAALLDITNPDARDWFWGKYERRENEGIAGWWSDLGEPEIHPDDMVHEGGNAFDIHNIYSLLWAKLLFERYNENYPDKRLFNLIRSGYAGMQRYSTFPWSGDVSRTWAGLRSQIPIMLGMSMSGVPYMGSDIGGFVGESDAELFTRWMQQGAFSPTMRAHGVNGITEPVYFDEPYRSITRDYIQLRYDFLPHNYSLAWRNSTSGRPFALPMHYFHPDDDRLQNINDQYYWGDNIIVAPVMQPGITSRNIILPDGPWINFWSDDIIEGVTAVIASAPLETMPVLVRAGSMIAQSTGLRHTDQFDGSQLSFHYYQNVSSPDHTHTYTYYEDNGYLSEAYKRNQYRTIDVHTIQSMNELQVDFLPGGPGYDEEPSNRLIEFVGHAGWYQVISATLDQSDIPLVNTFSEYTSTIPSVFQDNNGLIYAHFNWEITGNQLEINSSTTNTIDFIKSRINIYPNPSNGIFTVSLPDDLKTSHIRVIDVYGRTLLEQNTNSGGEYQVECPAGSQSAVVEVYNGNKLITAKKVILNN